MLRRSLVHRKARSLSALVAMTVSAGVATALLTLYADLDAKLHKEFRSFGANVVVTAPGTTGAAALPADALAQVQQAAGADALAAEFGYAVATTDRGTPVVVAGTDFDAVKRLNAWWQVAAWPMAADANVALLFYAETGLLAVFAGALGYLIGSGLAAWLGARIFAGDGAGVGFPVLIPVLLPVVVALALVVAIAGSTPSIRTALRMDPSAILRADA